MHQGKTAGERAICDDAALSEADRALADAYATLKRLLSRATFETIQAGQRAWLAYAHKSCGGDGLQAEGSGENRHIADCFYAGYESRTARLKDMQLAKAGSSVLEPRMQFRADIRRRIEETDIYPVMSGGPQAAAFNVFISWRFALGTSRINEKEMFQAADGSSKMKFHAHRSYSVARFDNRIASLQLTDNDYTGGNRDALSQRSFAWDLTRGRLVTLEDIFAPGKDWQTFAAEKCKESLESQLEDMEQSRIPDEEIAKTVRDSKSWLWGPDKVTIVFMPGTIGGLTAGEIDAGSRLRS